MRFQAVSAVLLASMFGLLAFGCGASGESRDESVASAAEEVIGARCSPYSTGPLPICGSTLEYCQVSACASIGACAAKPTACPAILDPVCGCNGVVYPNACQAARAGVSVKKKGRC
jgi:hypothetical protein